MTEEQKKAIDACKDQAAQEFHYESFPRLIEYVGNDPGAAKEVATIMTRAMQLYGDQCRKEGPSLERRDYMRKQAITIFELTKGFVGEPDNAGKAMLEMAGFVMELTAHDYKLTAPGR